MSSIGLQSHGSLPNNKLYGTNIVLGSNVNAPEQLASPWNNRGEVQRGQSKSGPIQDQTTKQSSNYGTNIVLGSQGTADQF